MAWTTASASPTVPKLRTVLWGWRGQPLGTDEIDGLRRIRDALDGDLGTELRVAAQPGGGPGDGAARRCAARDGPVPAALPDLAGHPLAPVLNRSREPARRTPSMCGLVLGDQPTDLAALTIWVLAKTSWKPCLVGLLAVVYRR